MTRSRALRLPVAIVALIVVAVGWTAATASPSLASTGKCAVRSDVRALTSAAWAAAARDIPDNQVFLTFRDTAAGYSIAFPEGWRQQGAGPNVTFQDKENRLHVVISKGAPFSGASVKADVASL